MITGATDFDLGSLALPQPEARSASTQLGQEEFLELMITQMKNQDPFEPMESGDFLGQLAQFSTVTGISDISSSVASLSEVLLSNQALQASTMVGRAVLVSSNQGELNPQIGLIGAVDMPDDAASVTIRITNEVGQLMRKFELTGQPGSLVNFSWDGVTQKGEPAAPGSYSIEANTHSGLTEFQVPTFTQVRVASVALDPSGSGSFINTEDGQQLRLSQVRAVM